MRLLAFVFFYCFFVSFSAQGQDQELERLARSKFEAGSRLDWVKVYHGYLGGIHEVHIALATKGKQCRGAMQYGRTRDLVFLEGTLDKGELLLKELNARNKVTGFVKGKLKEDDFKGTWSSFDDQFGTSLVWHIAPVSMPLPNICYESKFLRRYTGHLAESWTEIYLQHLHQDILIGKMYCKAENQTWMLRGALLQDGSSKLEVFDCLGNSGGTLHLKIQAPPGKLEVIWTKINRKSHVAPFDFSDKLNLGCQEYSGFAGGYEMVYPRSYNSSFNDFMSKRISLEAERNKRQLAQLQKQTSEANPERRNTLQFSSWMEVDFFNNWIISGIFEHQGPSGNLQGRSDAINFDLEKGVEIRFESVFKEGVTQSFLIDKLVRKEISRHQLAKLDPAFKQWLAEVDFPAFTIRREGINFSTAFHPVYGRHCLTIPFSKLRPYLQKNPLIDRIAN